MSTLKFFPNTHTYSLDGEPIQGVTTLLSGGVPKPALPSWAARTVAEYVADNPDEIRALLKRDRWSIISTLKQTPWIKRDEAGVKGTEIHAIAEDLIHGREVDVPERLLPYVLGYRKFLDDFEVDPIITEVSVANRRWWYAGRLDAIVRMGRGPWAGETCLLDWKTSKGVYGETSLQTAAYAMADFYTDGISDYDIPHIDRIGVVHIMAGESKLYSLGDIPKAFAEFRSAAYIAKTNDRRKALIGQPISVEVAVT